MEEWTIGETLNRLYNDMNDLRHHNNDTEKRLARIEKELGIHDEESTEQHCCASCCACCCHGGCHE